MTVSNRIYLDHAATTPVIPQAREAIAAALETWANPSSPHADGRAAKSILERSRQDIAAALAWRHEVIFTSGASESVEIAAGRARIAGRAHGATEHAIVPHAMGPGSKVIAVDAGGLINEDALEKVLAEGPALVAIQQVNNETGVVQSLDRIAQKVLEAGSLLLVDCAQSAGKMPLPDADFIAACGHKLGGPPGIGVLLVKDLATLAPVGGQEKGYRRGTQDAPSAAGFAAALTSLPYDMDRLRALRTRLDDAITAAGGVVVAVDSPRIPTITCYAMPGVTSSSQLVQFDLAGIAVSAGSACSSGSMKASAVLEAMAVPAEVAGCFLRISFGPNTSDDDVDRFIAEWKRIYGRATSRAA